MDELIIIRLEPCYCKYLTKFDNKVPVSFDSKVMRPFVGVLITINSFYYFAPLSSPKPKHQLLKNRLDFLKIDNGKLGVLNLNNMVPVLKENIIYIDLNNSALDLKYNKLLRKQIFWLNRNKKIILSKAHSLYEKSCDGKLDNVMKNRCCNFKLLEEKCLEYNKIHN